MGRSRVKEDTINTAHSLLERWLDDLKSGRDSSRIGMYLAHNGVVRGTTRDGSPVSGMNLSCDREHLQRVIGRVEGRPGVVAVRVWINQGALAVGDDIMWALVAGDIRENVFAGLQELIRLIKSEVIVERDTV